MDADEGTPEGDELNMLADLVKDYEDRHFPMGHPDPVAVIEFCMDQQGLAQSDLVPHIGSPSLVSEVLSRKHPITLPMACALQECLGVPVEMLLAEPAPTDDARLAAARSRGT